MSTNEYIRNVKTNNWQPFPGRLCQRNYHEHIIRNTDDLANTRTYIEQNPLRWSMNHPAPSLCINPPQTVPIEH
jgi:putative transposase